MKYILDTDIGTDADDAMALIQLLATGQHVIGITTSYGPTNFRARIARHYTDLMSAAVPIFAGEQSPMSGKKVWLTGREGRKLPNLNALKFEDTTAVDFLSRTLRDSIDKVTIICIGPLTNIGTLLEREPDIHNKIHQLVIMGGNFTSLAPEHNFACDSKAAAVVMSSGIDMTLVGVDATRQLRFFSPQIEEIASTGEMGLALAAETFDWWDFKGVDWGVPHDPIAICLALRPDLFQLSSLGSVEITQGGKFDGVSQFTPGQGTARFAQTFAQGEVEQNILEAVLRGCK